LRPDGSPGKEVDVEQIVLHEVGPRDGLQVEVQVVPTGKKLEWIRALAGSGLDLVQVGSFVRADRVPTMADTDRLFAELLAEKRPGAAYSGLVLNERGLERALAVGVEMICIGASASDTHSRKNTGTSSADATRRAVAMARQAVAAGKTVQVAVQSAFGCGFEGPIPEERVLAMVGAYAEAGLRNISLADTAGHAYPEQVRRLFGEVLRLVPDARCTGHFHDNHGLGIANVYAAMEVGVTTFETSVAGLGGCPFTKDAAGNVTTEDLVQGLQRSGRRAEVKIDQLVAVARDVATFFGREMPGKVHRAEAVH
jgi:hydroxymethylglutaryl-CoA lyase